MAETEYYSQNFGSWSRNADGEMVDTKPKHNPLDIVCIKPSPKPKRTLKHASRCILCMPWGERTREEQMLSDPVRRMIVSRARARLRLERERRERTGIYSEARYKAIQEDRKREDEYMKKHPEEFNG